MRVGTLFAVQGEKTAKLARRRGRRRRRHRQGRGRRMPANGSAGGKAPPTRRASRSRCAITRSPSRPRTARTTCASRPRSTSCSRRTAALIWEQDETMHETRLQGRQRRASEGHARPAEAALRRRRRFATSRRSATRNSIRKTVTQRGRHKKQSGGHGQFGDVRHRAAAAAARRGLQVRRQDHRRRRSPSSGSRRSRRACATRWRRARWASRWSTSR